MIDQTAQPAHHIQRHILDVLRRQEFARFRDLRPKGVDSNAFSYHLTRLLKDGLVDKREEGYTLSIQGIAHIDRVSSIDVRVRRQPKIMTMTVVRNERGGVLVRRKLTQPMINQLTFPTGMLHMDDATIADAAYREVREKMGVVLPELPQHIGDCYMAIRHEGHVLMNSLMHVFMIDVRKQDVAIHDDMFWRNLDDLDDAAPATRKIASVIKKGVSQRFFAEYSEEL